MRRISLLLCPAALLVVLGVTTAAPAAVTESFFAGGNASAKWVTFTPKPPGATDTASIALRVKADSGSDFDDFAGVEFLGLPSTPPAAAPSYAFRSNVTRVGSGGSPRLVMLFSDGGKMELRPLSWTANVWVTIDGNSNLWDNGGGTCGFLFATSYTTGLACHAGKSVTDVFIVSDSGWFSPGGYIHYIDDIMYGHEKISYPGKCIDDFTGKHEQGRLSKPIHNRVEPAVGSLKPTVHRINCEVVVPLGL